MVFEGFTTTIGQLNFLKWVIQNGISDHMLKNNVLPLKEKNNDSLNETSGETFS
jgi:hypothetical protein